ncbi:MAG TPA: lytic murein transglycosylase, partial [Burkholderiaceae bacterium]
MKLLTTICALSFSGFLLMPFDADAAAPRKPPHTAKPKDAPSRPLGETEAVRAFAAELATSQGFDADTVRRQLAEARVLPVVQRLIMPPAVGKAKDWDAYRALFIEPRRIEAGLDFWARYEADLARAEER